MMLNRLLRLAIIPFALLLFFESHAAGVISDDEARDHIGQVTTVRGVVANIYTSRPGNTFIDFGQPYPDQTFTAVVFAGDAGRFPDLGVLEGKRVSVTGRIKLYRGKPEIILKEAAQLHR